MRTDFFPTFGEAIRSERRRRGLNQSQLATRVGRATSRISELERDLTTGRLGKDRLTLLAEICDALDLMPVLVPRGQAQRGAQGAPAVINLPDSNPLTSVFDEVFVDISDEPTESDSDG
jgi:transcriptional regulator with XRE-family HTH domain